MNGAEMRLFLLILAIFLLGLRPAGAVSGALALDVLALTGVESLLGGGGGGMFFDEVRLNAKGFAASLLGFLLGELKRVGSTFSPS